MGFPSSSVGKEAACNAGNPLFNSWIRKIHQRRDRLPTPVFLCFPGGYASKVLPAPSKNTEEGAFSSQINSRDKVLLKTWKAGSVDNQLLPKIEGLL